MKQINPDQVAIEFEVDSFNEDFDSMRNGSLDVSTFVDRHFNELFDKHVHEMPYGTAKARDGDPFEWLEDFYAGFVLAPGKF